MFTYGWGFNLMHQLTCCRQNSYIIYFWHKPRTNARPFYWLCCLILKSDSGSRSTQWYASVSQHCPWYNVWLKSIMGHHMATWVACILTANEINNGVFSRPGRAALYWRFYIRPHSQSLPTTSSSFWLYIPYVFQTNILCNLPIPHG